jgi:GDP-L-fucose synthase
MPANLYGPEDNFNLETSHVLPALIRKFHLGKLLRQEKGKIQAQGKARCKEMIRDLKRFPIGFNLNHDLNLTLDSVDPDMGVKISRCLEKLGITSEYVRLWGTGGPCREFMYVDDLADCCLFLMNDYDAPRSQPGAVREPLELINTGSGKDIAIRDLAEMVKEVVGFEGAVEWDTAKPDGTPKKLLDVSKISKLGWSPKVSLEEGIRKTYQWYVTKQITNTQIQ